MLIDIRENLKRSLKASVRDNGYNDFLVDEIVNREFDKVAAITIETGTEGKSA